MAHKHNRRRARPRSRGKNRKDSESNSSSSNGSIASYDSFFYGPNMNISPPSFQYAIPAVAAAAAAVGGGGGGVLPPQAPKYSSQAIPKYINGAALRYNPQMVQTYLSEMTPQEAINTENHRLRMFGGEPGDDIDLCYKMMDAFDGMEWVNT